MGKPWEIIVGDVRRVLREMEAESFDAAFSDLPYGIGMSGTGAVKWDYDLPSVNVFVELLRVLRPGAYAMFFGRTRAFSRVISRFGCTGRDSRNRTTSARRLIRRRARSVESSGTRTVVSIRDLVHRRSTSRVVRGEPRMVLFR